MLVLRYLSILTLGTVLATPLAAAAQTTTPAPYPAASAAPMHSGHHRRHHGHSLMQAVRALDLTASQKSQIDAFRSQEREANQTADSATKRANSAKLREQIIGILTPDQKTQLDAQLHRQHANHGHPAPGADAQRTPAPQ